VKFSHLFVSLLCLSSMTACASKREPTQKSLFPPNVRIYRSPVKEVWKAVTDTVQFDFLMPFEVKDEKAGRFSTEVVRDYQPYQKNKFRISGTLVFDGTGVVVTLYKHQQVEQNGEWVTVASDLMLEDKILTMVAKKLQLKNQPK